MRYVLSKDFSLIKTSYGLFQNVSGDANIEITNDTNEQGILLKPFQTVEINTQVYARRISGGGTCALAVLPFGDSDVADDETSSDETTSTETPATSDNSDYHGHIPHGNPYDVFDNNFFHDKQKPHFPPPPPKPPEDGLTIRIPQEFIDKGQRKFVVELPDRKKG